MGTSAQQQALKQLRISIATDLLDGKTEEEIILNLTARGLSEANARILVNDARSLAASSVSSDAPTSKIWGREKARSEGYKKIVGGVIALVVWVGLTVLSITFGMGIPVIPTLLLIGALVSFVIGIIQVVRNS